MTAPEAGAVRRRFLLLTGLRWFPVGVLIPVFVLVLQERGLSLAGIGTVVAAQGIAIVLLELPTGGLADAVGRRPVLLGAGVVEVMAMTLFVWADSVALLVLVFALEGVYRALASGPLDSWYVDAAQRADPDADIEKGLAQAGVALGVALASGSLVGGAIVAWGAPVLGLTLLSLPIAAVAVIRTLELGAIAALVTEPARTSGRATVRTATRDAGRIVSEAAGLLRRSRWLLALVAVEVTWGAGSGAFEILPAPKLAEVLADPEAAAALLAPVGAVAWAISAAGAAAVPWLSRTLGTAPTGALLRVGQAATVVAMGLAAGPVGVVAGLLATYLVHGASNPVHLGLVHRSVGERHRTTLASASSMASSLGSAVGIVALGALADASSVTVATVAGGGLLALGAPFYLVRRDRPEGVGGRRLVAEPG